jgi:hypothetical protein
MKKSASKKRPTPAKKSGVSKKSSRVSSSRSTARSSTAGKPLVGKQPQSKKQAAIEAGMFLHTTDAWSAAYFISDDLHYMERELFG